MALMLAKTYAAFKAAGVPEAEAQAAAEEIAEFENRLTGIEGDIKLIKGELGNIRQQMATKAWVLAQTFVLLGGTAALVKILQ
jgi:hypothetical protein